MYLVSGFAILSVCGSVLAVCSCSSVIIVCIIVFLGVVVFYMCWKGCFSV